ncbi:MAG: agmatine deiminase family protein [Thermoplasmata archaeon]|nr:agmatine deiminase family protein [Thermoplasmata archaeon]
MDWKRKMLAIISVILISFSGSFYLSEAHISKDLPLPHLRQPAEFEPMEGVLIRYPFGISYEIIGEMAEDTKVTTIVANNQERNYVLNQYSVHGINISNCDFLIADTDTYWTRDYGPWFVFTGDGNLSVVDFTYNRPRPHDNQIPYNFAQAFGYNYYFMNLVHTGGNYMTDGHGIAVSTDLVWDENPSMSHAEINNTIGNYLGITKYHVVPDALGEYIKHIDCWAKFLAPDKIMIIQVPQTHPRYNEIEDAVSYFANQTSCYGTPYKIYRVYTPNGEPYINSLILNNKVLIPIVGSEWDDDAISAYENAMPGYEILGFTGSWLTTDALHCRAKGIPDRGMLYIWHIPLHGEIEGNSSGVKIEAQIIPYSKQNLINATVCWKTANKSWKYIPMEYEGNNTYYCFIPPQPNGTEISYYIHAEDASHRKENQPYMGAPQAYSFTYTTSFIPPTFNFTFTNGWNFVTIACENNYTASSLYNSIQGCNLILKWNNSKNDFDVYVPNAPDFVIEQGNGFFVSVSQQSIWYGN